MPRSVNYPSDGGITSVATFADLSSVNNGSMRAWVRSRRAWYYWNDQTTSWVREPFGDSSWGLQTTWQINTSTGSDDADGSASPLLTWTELSSRLGRVFIPASIAVAVTGDQNAADIPYFSYQTATGVSVTFTGTPVQFYSGTMTGTHNVTTATPTADETHFTDASITGGSFTNAGAMARGVQGKRTNGTVAWFYALHDNGTTQLRTSIPASTTGVASSFADNDTYTLSTLPKIFHLRGAPDVGPLAIKLVQFDMNVADDRYVPSLSMRLCTVTQMTRWSSPSFFNCCIDVAGGSLALEGVNGLGSLQGGCFRGTGATTYDFSNGNWNMEGGPVVFQGCGVLAEIGHVLFAGVVFYDTTTACLTSLTNSTIDLLGCLSGTGNTDVLFSAYRGGAIHGTPNPYWNAGCTSHGNLVRVNGVESATPGAATVDTTMVPISGVTLSV